MNLLSTVVFSSLLMICILPAGANEPVQDEYVVEVDSCLVPVRLGEEEQKAFIAISRLAERKQYSTSLPEAVQVQIDTIKNDFRIPDLLIKLCQKYPEKNHAVELVMEKSVKRLQGGPYAKFYLRRLRVGLQNCPYWYEFVCNLVEKPAPN